MLRVRQNATAPPATMAKAPKVRLSADMVWVRAIMSVLSCSARAFF